MIVIEYLKSLAPEEIDRKALKAIKKSTTFAKYRDAVGNI